MSATAPSRADFTAIAQAFDAVDGFGVALLDLDGNICSWNRGATRLFGHRPEAVIGRSIACLYVPDAQTSLLLAERLRRAAESSATVSYEGWRLRADGTPLWSEGDLGALRDGSGAVVGFIKTLHDRTY